MNWSGQKVLVTGAGGFIGSHLCEELVRQGATLRVEYQQARIAEAAEVGQVEIVDFATRAHAVQSGNTRVILFALMLGLFVGAMIELDQVRPLDAPELHTVRISLAVGRGHIEPPFAADANIY